MNSFCSCDTHGSVINTQRVGGAKFFKFADGCISASDA